MKLYNGVVQLGKIQTWAPSTSFVEYTDVDGNRIIIPMDVLIRLYEGSKYHLETAYGIDFNQFSDDVLSLNRDSSGDVFNV